MCAHSFSPVLSRLVVNRWAALIPPLMGVLPMYGIRYLLDVKQCETVTQCETQAALVHVALSLLNPFYGLAGTILYLQTTAGSGSVFFSLAAAPLYCTPVCASLMFAAVILIGRCKHSPAGPPEYGSSEHKGAGVLTEEDRVACRPEGDAVTYRGAGHRRNGGAEAASLHAMRCE